MHQFLTDNSIYVVLAIVLTIWLGIAVYLLKIDKNLNKMEKRFDNGLKKK